MTPIRLLVGLGNPGREYRDTRHNVGFWWIDQLAEETHAALKPESRFRAEVARVRLSGNEVCLLKPQTYMNASGQAVALWANYYKITPEEILVVHDELDLPPGAVRLKRGGGSAGHNGLKDIIAHCGAGFWRLRLGIGHPGQRDKVVDYVLHRPSREDETALREAIARSLSVLPLIVAGDLETAMHRLHSRSVPAGSDPPAAPFCAIPSGRKNP